MPAERVVEIERLRRQRMTGPAIARTLGLPRSTVGVVLRRLGLGRLKALDAPPPAIRYERERPGELIHIDTKKLGRIDDIGHRITGDRTGQSNKRGIGWEALHVCIDDASRLAYSEMLAVKTRRTGTPSKGTFERLIQFHFPENERGRDRRRSRPLRQCRLCRKISLTIHENICSTWGHCSARFYRHPDQMVRGSPARRCSLGTRWITKARKPGYTALAAANGYETSGILGGYAYVVVGEFDNPTAVNLAALVIQLAIIPRTAGRATSTFWNTS